LPGKYQTRRGAGLAAVTAATGRHVLVLDGGREMEHVGDQ